MVYGQLGLLGVIFRPLDGKCMLCMLFSVICVGHLILTRNANLLFGVAERLGHG